MGNLLSIAGKAWENTNDKTNLRLYKYYALYNKILHMSTLNIIMIMQYLLVCFTMITYEGRCNMIADRIKSLREQQNKTQAELAKILGITRSSVNAWEMGISVPSTQYIVELANIFEVSTDYLLGVKKSASISVAGLSDKDIELVSSIISHLRERKK